MKNCLELGAFVLLALANVVGAAQDREDFETIYGTEKPGRTSHEFGGRLQSADRARAGHRDGGDRQRDRKAGGYDSGGCPENPAGPPFLDCTRGQ